MKKVRICLTLDDHVYQRYAAEAKQEGVSVESLVERVAARLLDDLEQEEKDGTDHPIIPC